MYCNRVSESEPTTHKHLLRRTTFTLFFELFIMTMQMERGQEDVPWNVPTIRVWEINSNSTRYEKLIAAPSDHEMRLMWFLWAAIMGIVTLFTFSVFIGVISSPKARRNPFNFYLVCLMIPDMIMSAPCFVTCLLNGIHGRFTTEVACKAQSFYFIFGIGANAWLNATICRQLYCMLGSAKTFQRYAPPTHKKVLFDSLAVYLLAAFVASWGLWDKPWWPHKTQLVNGTACVPMDYSLASTLFFYFVFFPALMGIPMGYVGYVGYQIYKQNLLPPTGRRRVLAIYFLRLAAVFLVMWLPALLFFFIIGPWVGHWVLWGGGAWSHLQGGVSAAVSLWKPDIYEAVIHFWTCQSYLQFDDQLMSENARVSFFTRVSATVNRVTRQTFVGTTHSDGSGGHASSIISQDNTIKNFRKRLEDEFSLDYESSSGDDCTNDRNATYKNNSIDDGLDSTTIEVGCTNDEPSEQDPSYGHTCNSSSEVAKTENKQDDLDSTAIEEGHCDDTSGQDTNYDQTDDRISEVAETENNEDDLHMLTVKEGCTADK